MSKPAGTMTFSAEQDIIHRFHDNFQDLKEIHSVVQPSMHIQPSPKYSLFLPLSISYWLHLPSSIEHELSHSLYNDG